MFLFEASADSMDILVKIDLLWLWPSTFLGKTGRLAKHGNLDR